MDDPLQELAKLFITPSLRCPYCNGELYGPLTDIGAGAESQAFCQHCGRRNPYFNAEQCGEEVAAVVKKECERGHLELKADIRAGEWDPLPQRLHCIYCGAKIFDAAEG